MRFALARPWVSAALVAPALWCAAASGAQAQDRGPGPATEDLDDDDRHADDAGSDPARPGLAADEEDPDLAALLEERVVTTASRSAERASAAPSTVYTITQADLQRYGMRALDEALSFLGIGVYTQRHRDYVSGSDVGVQGQMIRDGNVHVLVLLDGHVLNFQDIGQISVNEALGVPLEAIDHVEVMLGPGSVAYGSNAMAAVIHVFTNAGTSRPTVRAIAELGTSLPTDAQRELADPTAPGRRLGLRYRFGLAASTGFELFGSDGTVSIHGEWLEDLSESFEVLTLSSPDDFDVGLDGRPWGGAGTTSLAAPSVLVRARLGDFQLLLAAHHFERSMPFTGVYSFPDSREERSAYRADLSHRALLTPEVSLTTRLYADLTTWSERATFTRLFYCLPEQLDGCRFERSSTGRSAGAEQTLQVDWTLDGRFATTIGYDVRGRHMTARPADFSDALTHEGPLAQRLPYASRVTVLGAVYAQQIIRPLEWLTINVGARLDADSLFGARLSPRGAVVVTPVDGTTIRASYSEAFRAPTAYELTEIDPTYRLPPRSLRPEVVRNVELEWQQRIEWLSFSARGFAAFYEDLIDFESVPVAEAQAAIDRGDLVSSADPESIGTRTNLGAYRSLGGTFAVTARPIDGLEIAASFTIAHNRLVVTDAATGDSREDPVIWLPDWYGNARVSYQFARDGASIALAALVAAPRIPYLQASLIDPVTMEYLTFGPELGPQLDLRATFLSPIDPIPGLQLRVALGYSVNPRVPSLYSDALAGTPGPTAYYPQVGSTFGLVGLSYTLAP